MEGARAVSGHRIELHVSFTVDDGDDGGREAAEEVLRQFQYLADHGQLDNYTTDVEVWPGTVDGIGWDEKWPKKTAHATAADADAALASGLETYNDLDKAIERLRQLQSDVREEMKALSYFRDLEEREPTS